ncbi:MAG: hypothetical protein K2O18_04160 [Oscillospiraceae bacterium]|nr:hypothetical protein [Oscillospiraceae bacterium]
MKRYLVLLPLLLALSVGTLLAGHKWLDSAKDKIEITEHVLEGDPAAADVTITYRTEDQKRQLFWDTSFSPGRAGESETDFTLSLTSRSYTQTRQNYVAIYTFGNLGYTTSVRSGWLEENDASYPDTPILAIRAVAKRTPNGEERTETVRLADYYEYYPLVLDVGNGYLFDIVSSLQVQQFSDYFRLKVPEEKLIEITVRKDGGGNVDYLNININPELEVWDNLDTRGVVTDSGVYLITTSVTDGVPDGRLQCPDGPGVHFIPPVKGEPFGPYEWWDVSKVRLFYPTGDALTIELALSQDQTKLLLYTKEAGKLVLTILDIETGNALQRIELMEFDGSGGLTCLEQDDLVYIQQENAFCLIQEAGGRYETVLTGTPSEDLTRYYFYYPDYARLAWDGQRMVLAATAEYCSFYNNNEYQIMLGVWDAAGLRFLGGYDYSISRDPYSRFRLMRYSSAPEPLGIAFSGPSQK